MRVNVQIPPEGFAVKLALAAQMAHNVRLATQMRYTQICIDRFRQRQENRFTLRKLVRATRREGTICVAQAALRWFLVLRFWALLPAGLSLRQKNQSSATRP